MKTKIVKSVNENKYKIEIASSSQGSANIEIYDRSILGYRPLDFHEDNPTDIGLDETRTQLIINTSPTEQVIFYRDGRIYEGGLKDGLYHGKGKLTEQDGSYFEGEFVNDKLNGKFCIIKTSDFIYEGGLKDGLYHGKGKLTEQNGSCFEGEFASGKKNGKFRIVSTSGYTYEGEIKNDKIHGEGKFILQDGTTYKGEFNDGMVVNPNLSKDSKKKKDQTVLLINHESSFSFINVKRLLDRYKNVKLLQRDGVMNAVFLESLITQPTKKNKKENKLKFSILEHAKLNGNLGNESFILKALKDTLKEVKEYNNSHPENKIMNIDIVLDCCNGNEVVCNNKKFQEILKEFTKAKIGIKIVTGGEKTLAIDLISNGKKLLRIFRTKGKKVKHVYHVFRFNKESDFKSIKPSEVKEYDSVAHFLKDQYAGKERKSNKVNYEGFKPKERKGEGTTSNATVKHGVKPASTNTIKPKKNVKKTGELGFEPGFLNKKSKQNRKRKPKKKVNPI